MRKAAVGATAALALIALWVGWSRSSAGEQRLATVEPAPPVAALATPTVSIETVAETEPVAAAPETIRVLEVDGSVERRGVNSDWAVISAGEELRVEDAIRTSRSGRAVLGIGDGGRVEVMPRSEFSVREISSTFARVRLEQGRLSAALPDGTTSKLRVETQGSDAAVEAERGKFVVLGNGKGQLAVAAQSGSVRLSVGAASVVVHEGQQSETTGASAPSRPHVIPRTLYLKVARPSATVQRERETTVQGRTAPGAVVSVNGIRAPADAKGSFRVKVPLKDGKNTLVVEAEDVLGKVKRRSLPSITVKRQVSDVRARVTWSKAAENE